MKRLFFLTILIIATSCSKSDDNTNIPTPPCQEKVFSEAFIAAPNDCFIFIDDPIMTFTLVSFEPFTKNVSDSIPYASDSIPNKIPYAAIRASIFIDDLTWEFPHKIYEDYKLDGTSFSGFINAGINKNTYTIYFDEIEFTETLTQFIFHRAKIRLKKRKIN